MSRLPAAIFVVDTLREHIAVKEAQKLNIPVFALVDTNSNPRDVDYAIPANDDASKSIHKVMSYMTDSILEGLSERKDGKDAGEDKPAKAKKEANTEAKAEKKAAVVEEAPEDKVKEETNTEAQPEKAPVVDEVPIEKAEPKKPAGEENKTSE